MSEYASKKDIMLFEDEILGDIKKLDNKLSSKYDEKINDLANKIVVSEQKVVLLSDKIGELYETIANQKDSNSKISQIINFKQKTEESMFLYDTKIHSIEKDLGNAIYKFDNMFSNILVPGLIGNACRYPTVRHFLDYCNKTFMDLKAFKDKQIMDLKTYKTKLESLVTSFNLQIENVQQKFIEHFNKRFVEVENKLIDRIKITDDRIDVLRVDNLKYANDLIEETKKLGIKWEKLDAFEIKMNNKFDSEIEKFVELNEKTVKEFNEYQYEFKLLKQKFTTLSDFIKDVRFRKNLGQNVPLKEFRQMGNKLDFRKKQKLENETSKDELETSDFFKNKNSLDFQIDDEEIPGSPMSSRLVRRKRDMSMEVNIEKNLNVKSVDKNINEKKSNDNDKNNIKYIILEDDNEKDNKNTDDFILKMIKVDEENENKDKKVEKKNKDKREEKKNEDNKSEKKNKEKTTTERTQNQNEKTTNVNISNYRNELKNINQNAVRKKRFSVIATPESFKHTDFNLTNTINKKKKPNYFHNKTIHNTDSQNNKNNSHNKTNENNNNNLNNKINNNINENNKNQNNNKDNKDNKDNNNMIKNKDNNDNIIKNKDNKDNKDNNDNIIKNEDNKDNNDNIIKKEDNDNNDNIIKNEDNDNNDNKDSNDIIKNKDNNNNDNNINENKSNKDNKKNDHNIQINNYIIDKDNKDNKDNNNIQNNNNNNDNIVNNTNDNNINVNINKDNNDKDNKNNKVSEISNIKKNISPKKNLATLDYSEEKNFQIKEQINSLSKNDKNQKIPTDNEAVQLTPNTLRKKRVSLFNNNINNDYYIEMMHKFSKQISDLSYQIEKNENHLYGLEAATSKKFEEVLEQIRNLLNNIQPHHKKKTIISEVFSNNDNLSLGNHNNFLMTTINFAKKSNFSNMNKPKKKINIKIDAEQSFNEKKANSSYKDFSKINIISETDPPYLKTENSIETLNTVEPFLIKKFTQKQ